jgi:hypothetical protein
MMDLDQAALTARFDAQDNLLRALAITQSEHTRRPTRLEGKVDRLEGGQRDLQGAVARVEVGLQTIITLLGRDHEA